MVLVISHRGFSGKYPENTMLAFQKAAELGVDWIELDVHLTADHRLVIMHDPKMNRTTTGRGSLSKKTRDEISRHHTKEGNQPIPSLEEALSIFNGIKTKPNIEIKRIWAAKPTADMIRSSGLEGKAVISSGSLLTLSIIKREIPSIKTSWLFFLVPTKPSISFFGAFLFKVTFRLTRSWVVHQATRSGVDYVSINYLFATKSFIGRLHAAGLKVNAWSVDTKPLMRKLISNGIDGIITNRPDLLKEVISEIKRPKPTRKTGRLRFLRIGGRSRR